LKVHFLPFTTFMSFNRNYCFPFKIIL
jgi:hypothetical protein